MSTVLSIINSALVELGQEPLTTLPTTADAARVNRLAATMYEPSRDAVLEEHTFNCATARCALTVNGFPPSHGFDFAFDLPDDFIAMIRLDGDHHYQIEGRQLLTDANPAYIRYTQQMTDPALMNPALRKLIALELAERLATALKADESVKKTIAGLKQMELDSVRYKDAVQSQGDRYESREWLDAHEGYGRGGRRRIDVTPEAF